MMNCKYCGEKLSEEQKAKGYAVCEQCEMIVKQELNIEKSITKRNIARYYDEIIKGNPDIVFDSELNSEEEE